MKYELWKYDSENQEFSQIVASESELFVQSASELFNLYAIESEAYFKKENDNEEAR